MKKFFGHFLFPTLPFFTAFTASAMTATPLSPENIFASSKAQSQTLSLTQALNKISDTSINDEEKDIIVAVIDTGIDIKHPALKKYIWENPKEKSNGIDNDGNGFAQDFHGWNFSSNSNDVSDRHGHGTHIAGLILQNAGLARRHIKILPIKYYDVDNSQQTNLRNTIRAIEYAVRMGASIINYSAGGFQPSEPEREVIRWAGTQGVLVVAAAGNEATNTDHIGFYPASYDMENVVSVTALNRRDQILSSSNFGPHSVQFAARGERMISTLPGNTWGEMSGTSQATAVATGRLAEIYVSLQELNLGKKQRGILALDLLKRECKTLPQLVAKTKYAKKIPDTLQMSL